MFAIHLPIADIAISPFILLALGAGVGVITGMFGIGGGFLTTPALIVLGIPPLVAVGSEANHILGSSLSGLLTHWRRGNIDPKMGLLLLLGGLLGSGLGVFALVQLKEIGQLNLVLRLAYALLLAIVGSFMLLESIHHFMHRKKRRPHFHRHTFIHRLPWRMRFPKSRLYISALAPLGIGAAVGFLSGSMGIGGGFILVPALIYMLGVPTKMVIGTSLLHVTVITANTTILHAVIHHSVDILLSLLLIIGGAVGIHLGARASGRVDPSQLRILLALVIIIAFFGLFYGLLRTPEQRFILE